MLSAAVLMLMVPRFFAPGATGTTARPAGERGIERP
jgi:hypothetical protein